MEQVFCSSSPVADQRNILLQGLWHELDVLSAQCPGGEKSFEHLLQLLQQLLNLSGAADALSESSDPDDPADEHFSQILQQNEKLAHEVDDLKDRLRCSCRQLEEAEEENQKLLDEKSEQDQAVKRLKRQVQLLEHQNNDQIAELTGQLQAEQRRTKLLQEAGDRLRAAGRLKEAAGKSLEQEMREIGSDATTQTKQQIPDAAKEAAESEPISAKARNADLQVVHLSNDLISAVSESPATLQKLNYSKFLLFVVVCLSTGLCTLETCLFDDVILTYCSELPPV